MDVSITEPGPNDRHIEVTYTWTDNIAFIREDMDQRFGRFLVAFFKEDLGSTERSRVVRYPVGSNSYGGSEHWVIAMGIVGTSVAGHDRKRIKDSRVG